MKKFIPIIFITAMFAVIAVAQMPRNAPAPIPVEKAPITVMGEDEETSDKAEVIKGIVVSYSDLIKGGDGRVSKSEAFSLVESGQPIGLLVGSKFYFVYDNDMNYDGKTLANFAGVTAAGALGVRFSRNGLNFIKATKIRAM
ncbi:MAG: hypothetical protein ACLFQX_07335 [Candidatus Kapaibacterium sp.]